VSWINLGTIVLTNEWQTFDVAVIGTETFRISMPPGLVVDGYILITQYFALAGRGISRRFYPTDEPRIITFPIPKDLRDAGQIVRYIQARKTYRTRVLAGQTWSLTVEEFSP
jgi:hypothetical protein